MTLTTRERNMRRILLLFALICFLLAGYLFVERRELGARLAALTAANRAVQQNPQLVRRKLRRTEVLMWAAVGGGVLLIVSAAATGWTKGSRPS
jgi:hypothetical protein